MSAPALADLLRSPLSPTAGRRPALRGHVRCMLLHAPWLLVPAAQPVAAAIP